MLWNGPYIIGDTLILQNSGLRKIYKCCENYRHNLTALPNIFICILSLMDTCLFVGVGRVQVRDLTLPLKVFLFSSVSLVSLLLLTK